MVNHVDPNKFWGDFKVSRRVRPNRNGTLGMLEATGVVGIGSLNKARTLSATTVDWQNHK